VLGEVGDLAHGDDEEQFPQVVAVLKPGELPPLGTAGDAVEDAQGDVLLIGGGPPTTTSPPGTVRRR